MAQSISITPSRVRLLRADGTELVGLAGDTEMTNAPEGTTNGSSIYC